jgi:hypothetical protein
VRGALDQSPTYADDYRGWPLAPKRRAHGVYGTFLNPTTTWANVMPEARTGYHKAIDIPVDDSRGAQPVFAIEGGVVREAKPAKQKTPLGETVSSGTVGIGHFRYAHVVPSVEAGERVEPGDPIGRSVPGWWHIHLEEILTVGGKRLLVNPMRPGGKLAPLNDRGRPFISDFRIYAKADEASSTARPLGLDRVRGVVVPVALAMDEFPYEEWPRAPRSPLHVYRASISLKRGAQTVLARDLFRIDTAPGPTWQHFFRPLTRRSAPVSVCAVRRPPDCGGRFWLRLWERGWDTRRVPNGQYELTLTVADTVGRTAGRTLAFSVRN